MPAVLSLRVKSIVKKPLTTLAVTGTELATEKDVIGKPYVLFTRIPLTRTKQGRLFCDHLWAKDLRLHLDYLANFRICCPVVYSEETDGLVDITGFNIDHVYALRRDLGLGSILRNLLPNFLTVSKAARWAEVAHSDGAGWAFPLSYYLLLLRPFIRFKWVIVIESSFWMLGDNDRRTLRSLFEHYHHTVILKRCLRIADARIFTSSFYRRYFLGDVEQRALVALAVWIDKENLLSAGEVTARFEARRDKPLEVLFPTQLIEDKGVHVLFEAIRLLHKENVEVAITIMGKGKLEQQCRDFASRDHGSVKVKFHEPVRYGEEFYSVLRAHDAVLLANLKEETQRLIFDAFSQGVGVIGSDTSGILDSVNESNSIIYRKGDSVGLSRAIVKMVNDPKLRLSLGLAGLEHAKEKTHRQMHDDRLRFFHETLCI